MHILVLLAHIRNMSCSPYPSGSFSGFKCSASRQVFLECRWIACHQCSRQIYGQALRLFPRPQISHHRGIYARPAEPRPLCSRRILGADLLDGRGVQNRCPAMIIHPYPSHFHRVTRNLSRSGYLRVLRNIFRFWYWSVRFGFSFFRKFPSAFDISQKFIKLLIRRFEL